MCLSCSACERLSSTMRISISWLILLLWGQGTVVLSAPRSLRVHGVSGTKESTLSRSPLLADWDWRQTRLWSLLRARLPVLLRKVVAGHAVKKEDLRGDIIVSKAAVR